MIETYLTGIGGFTALAIIWVVVQWLWRKTFPEQLSDDDDVLEIRGTCSNCGCFGVCKDKQNQIPIKR